MFAAGDYRPTWLIPGVLVKHQPGAVGGPSKAMKTSFIVDAGVSVAAGAPFLGKFPVEKPARVAMLSLYRRRPPGKRELSRRDNSAKQNEQRDQETFAWRHISNLRLQVRSLS